MIDNNLFSEYMRLSDQEKNALMVYKSKLGLLINELQDNPDFLTYYEELKKMLANPKNILMKYTVYKDIDISSLNAFRDSILKIKDILDGLLNKIVLEDEIDVYRLVSNNKQLKNLAKGNIISTSLSFGEVFKFAKKGEQTVIYQIHLHAGSPIMYVPYSVLYNSKTGQLILSNSRSQDEIILDNNNYVFEELGNVVLENGTILKEIDAKVKNKTRM